MTSTDVCPEDLQFMYIQGFWVYNFRGYRCLGVCTSSDIVKNVKEHNVSGAGSVSILR
jgi:hypothetical protein